MIKTVTDSYELAPGASTAVGNTVTLKGGHR